MKPIEFIRKDPSIANFAEILEEFFVIRDVLVIKKVVEFLLFLEENDRNFIYLSPQPIFINGKVVLFTEFIKSL